MAIDFILFLLVVVPAFWAALYVLIRSERLSRLFGRFF
jgi:hypothetical protein